jgi:hypothetical protein
VGADGLIKYAGVNEARFDHNPVTGESLGLLIEEQRTNLVLNSLSGYSNVYPQNATVTTGIDAPDGSNTAIRVSCRTNGDSLIRMNTSTISNNITYTISFYVRLIGGNSSVSNTLTSDLCDGGTFNYLPLLVRNKWVRITYSSFRGLPNQPGLNFVDLLSDKINNYTLDFWGPQLEAGAFPTSYIPTTTAAATRSADVARITGANFSSWYRQTEGTVFGDYVGVNNVNVSGATRRLVEIGVVGLPNDRMILGYNNVAASRFLVVVAAASQADINPSATQGARIKTAACFAVNNFQQGANGSLGTADTSGNVPTVSAIAIGNDFTSSAATSLNGTIRRLTYWPKRLPNSQLQALTR